MGTPSLGSAGQMALDTTSSFSSSSKWIEFNGESVAAQRTILDSTGIRGTRSRSQERTRSGPYRVSGAINMDCSTAMLDVWLSYILGSGPVSSVYSLAETLPSFYLLVDRGAKVFTYGPCYVSKATFSASPRRPRLTCTVEIEAETESVGDAGTFVSGQPDAKRPFIYSDLALSLLGNSYSAFGFDLTIDNHLLPDRFVNELTRSHIPAVDRSVTCKLTTPWTGTEAPNLYNLAAGAFGAASAVFTNAEESSSVLTFAMPYLQFPGKSPNITGKSSEIRLELDGTARRTGASPELTITNAHS